MKTGVLAAQIVDLEGLDRMDRIRRYQMDFMIDARKNL